MHMKRCWLGLIISEMQIKAPVKSHNRLIREAMIKTNPTKCWKFYRGNETFYYVLLIGI